MGKIIQSEEIGKIYGCYKILSFCDRSVFKKLKCVCECQKCGNIKEVLFEHVRDRKYEYCTSCIRPRKIKKDLVGKRFGKLVVTDYFESKVQPNGSTKVQYKCRCDCGNECVVQSNHLITGHTTSCGCFQKETMSNIRLKDISGKRFGRLVAEERVIIDGKPKWKCKCDCGSETFVDIRYLNGGHTNSCGCLSSVAEEKMSGILKRLGFLFEREYRIKDCKDIRCLPFDFAIFENNKLLCLVELQGQQHYQPFTYNNEPNETKLKNFEDRLKKDNIKKEYCQKHNIPLLLIKYDKFSKMEQILKDFIDSL